MSLRLGVLAFVVMTGCPRGITVPPERVGLLVLAPHPDDEALLAAGMLRQALSAGEHVAVVLMTNGDFTCERDGYQRESETFEAMQLLGVPPQDIHFLGYPDGALVKLTSVPLAPLEHRDPNGNCIARTGTYADRSAGRIDEHTKRTGSPAEWTSTALTEDLRALLARLDPREVVLPHAIDDHPDHAMTYVYFRRALDGLTRAPTLVHRGVVHAGRCWPSDCQRYFVPDQSLPPLPAPLTAYVPDERRPTDARLKLNVIAHYTSQTGTQPRLDWLASFARPEEVFFTERYRREGNRWVQEGAHPTSPDRTERMRDGFREWNEWGPEGFSGAGVIPPPEPPAETPVETLPPPQ